MTDEQLIREVGRIASWDTGNTIILWCTKRIVALVAREMRERLAVWCSTMPLSPEDREKVERRIRALPIPGERPATALKCERCDRCEGRGVVCTRCDAPAPCRPCKAGNVTCGSCAGIGERPAGGGE